MKQIDHYLMAEDYLRDAETTSNDKHELYCLASAMVHALLAMYNE